MFVKSSGHLLRRGVFIVNRGLIRRSLNQVWGFIGRGLNGDGTLEKRGLIENGLNREGAWGRAGLNKGFDK